MKHSIDTIDATPIREPPRRLPLGRENEAQEAVQDMSNQGVTQPSQSAWSSPVMLVKKKDSGIRFCVDYRKFNDITIKYSPCIDDSVKLYLVPSGSLPEVRLLANQAIGK